MAQTLVGTVRADHLAMDDGRLGCEGNHRRAWNWLRDNATNSSGWSVVLEDDAQPTEGFRDQLDAALAVAPSPVVSLYLGRERPPYAQERIARAVVRAGDSASWIVAPRMWFAVGVAVLSDLVPDLTQYLECDPRKSRPIDEAIGRWAMKHRRPVAYTWPSLVDHADVVPVIGQRADRQSRDRGRRAWLVGGRQRWTTDTVTI
ncbi:hypothetical protein A5712_21630 [Mycobacterium sp. E2327]|uniref:hypothetical protein n=1 Tax=Mycobacterium sp. E2327 TaxID=1834132 RepID=UPI0007FFEA55|nr:hypothetical protein [Mycobacterium sp. E2327]OBI18593.1 hypothetical protein A5712_21630 [Mycobacterium sp. E2327]